MKARVGSQPNDPCPVLLKEKQLDRLSVTAFAIDHHAVSGCERTRLERRSAQSIQPGKEDKA